MPSFESLLDLSFSATEAAGKITLEYFQTNLQIERKADQSPVTVADRKSEEKIRDMITRSFPNHGIVGEEFGETPGTEDYTWYIDPIDGTQAFIRGVPIYGVLLGVMKGKELIVGVVHMPALNETVSAAAGQGCHWNGRKVTVSDTSNLGDALFCHAGAEYFQETGKLQVYDKLVAATYRQRTWGDCFAHVLVATGRADLCVDPILSSWDAAAMVPILKEAGGSFTDWKGRETIFHKEGISVNRKLRSQVLQITQGHANSF